MRDAIALCLVLVTAVAIQRCGRTPEQPAPAAISAAKCPEPEPSQAEIAAALAIQAEALADLQARCVLLPGADRLQVRQTPKGLKP